MNFNSLRDWLHEHPWWTALICVLIFGYSFGKHMALRDNARDVAMVQGTG